MQGNAPDISPPRERKKQQSLDGRKFSWATQRIHDLEKELELAKAKIKVRRNCRGLLECAFAELLHLQELRTQLHKDGQEQQVLLDQQHEVIQQLEQQQQALQVHAAFMQEGAALQCDALWHYLYQPVAV